MKDWFSRRVWMPLLGFMRQGVSPERLALCVAIGIVVGNIPILGISTIICTAVALLLRLNLAAIQLVQWLMAPSQLLLIIPYVRLGEWLTGAAHQRISIQEGMLLLERGIGTAIRELWEAIVHAGIGFALVAPPAIYLLYRLLTPVLRHAARRLPRSAVVE